MLALVLLFLLGCTSLGGKPASLWSDRPTPQETPPSNLTPQKTVPPTPEPTPTTIPTPESLATNDPRALERLAGYILPLAGAALPQDAGLLPGAPRAYRAGIHEGIDFYWLGSGAAVTSKTEVLAAQRGRVIRVDRDFQELSRSELEAVLERSLSSNSTSPEDLDRLRGRQVWIEHGQGIITRYAHLSAIRPEIEVGRQVERGEVIAYAGNSGTPEAQEGPEVGVHLHFEIRIGEGYLGEGLSAEEMRAWMRLIFGG